MSELQSACRLSKLVATIDCQEIDRLLDASGVEVLLVQGQWESVVVAIAVLLVSLLLLVSLVKRGRTEEQVCVFLFYSIMYLCFSLLSSKQFLLLLYLPVV